MQSIEDYFAERYRNMVERISESCGNDILSIMSAHLPFKVYTYDDAIRAIDILPSWVIASMYSTMIHSQYFDRMGIFIQAIKDTAKKRGMPLNNCAGCSEEVLQFEKYCEACANIEYS